MEVKRSVLFNMVWKEYADGSSALFPDTCICGSTMYYIDEGVIRCSGCDTMRPFSSWTAPPEVFPVRETPPNHETEVVAKSDPLYTGDNDFKQSGR